MRYSIFDSHFFFDPQPLLAILKTLLSFFYFVQYNFTSIFKFWFHACYFLYILKIRHENTVIFPY